MVVKGLNPTTPLDRGLRQRLQMIRRHSICKVSCVDCNKVYISETGRMRLKEQRYTVKQDEKNRIAVHIQESKHSMKWEATGVSMNEEHITKRKVLESVLIVDSDNLDAGLSLIPIRRPFLKAHHADCHENVPTNILSTTPVTLSFTRLKFSSLSS